MLAQPSSNVIAAGYEHLQEECKRDTRENGANYKGDEKVFEPLEEGWRLECCSWPTRIFNFWDEVFPGRFLLQVRPDCLAPPRTKVRVIWGVDGSI
jgi:hypothetical protein